MKREYKEEMPTKTSRTRENAERSTCLDNLEEEIKAQSFQRNESKLEIFGIPFFHRIQHIATAKISNTVLRLF